MDTQTIVTDLKNVLKQHGVSGSVEVQEYNIFDGYYERHKNIFNSSECWFENVQPVEPMQSLRGNVDFNSDVILDECDLTDVVEEFLSDRDIDACERYAKAQNLDVADVTVGGMTLSDLKVALGGSDYEELEAAIWDYIEENWDTYEAENSGLFSEEAVRNETDPTEAMAYWTVYFEPREFDPVVARECHLVPFYWRPRESEDLDLLALGGCGMDMSPKLDAYQALVDGTLPAGSMLLSGINRDYCVSMLGEATYEKALSKARLKSPAIILRTY